jgi:hypothetical protein
MRQSYAHDAVLEMAPEADVRAPGAAVTVALCGHWDHHPPCPLAPHHTRAERVDDRVAVRILFATEPDREALVRERIDEALAHGRLDGPDGTTTWRLASSHGGTVSVEERDHAERLTRT